MIISDKKFQSILDNLGQNIFLNNKENLSQYRDNVMEIMSIYYLYNYTFPLMLYNNIDNIDERYNKENHFVEDPSGKYFGQDIRWDLFASHQINIDTGLRLYELISQGKITSIINCGTGCASTLAYIDLASKNINFPIEIISYEHLFVFNKIGRYCLDRLVDFGVCPNNINITFYDSKIIPFSNHLSYSMYEKFINSEDIRISYSDKYSKVTLLTYDSVPDDKKYDLLIIDGPSFFRFPTLLSMLNRVSDNGIVLFEGCRKEIPIIKYLNIPIISETGIPQHKLYKMGNDKYQIFSTTIVNAIDIKNKLKKYQ